MLFIKLQNTFYQPTINFNIVSKYNKNIGGGKRIRTADICLAKAALYQLSYTPHLINFEK